MKHTFHCHLRRSFRWYHNWHDHPHHQHTHWLIFLIFSFFIFNFIQGDINKPWNNNELKFELPEAQAIVCESCADKLQSDKYSADIRTAAQEFVAANPDVENISSDGNTNTSLVAVARVRDGVIAILISRGFNAEKVISPEPYANGEFFYPQMVNVWRAGDPDKTTYRVTAGGGIISQAINVGYCGGHVTFAGADIIPAFCTDPVPTSIPTLVIISITPNSGADGIEFTITGNNLDQCEPITLGGGTPSTVCNVQFFDSLGNRSTVSGTKISSTTVIGVVPGGLCPGVGSVKVGDLVSFSNELPFTITSGSGVGCAAPTLNPPEILDFFPRKATHGSEITIVGNFLTQNTQFIPPGGLALNVQGWVSEDRHVARVTVPSTLSAGFYNLGITGPDGSAISDDTLELVADSAIQPQSTDIFIPQSVGFGDLVSNIFTYSIGLVGLAVFIMILYGGFLWLTSAANPSNIAVAKKYIYNALLGALLLIASYVILYTINPEFVGGDIELPEITNPNPFNPLPSVSTPILCGNLAGLAQRYGYTAPYLPHDEAELAQLLTCIAGRLPGQNLGSVATYEQSNDTCNYTRGNPVCGACAHSINSCHYGGRTGQGALAVDYGNEAIGNQIISAALACGAKSARCENNSGQTIANCVSGSTHVHVNAASCDSN